MLEEKRIIDDERPAPHSFFRRIGSTTQLRVIADRLESSLEDQRMEGGSGGIALMAVGLLPDRFLVEGRRITTFIKEMYQGFGLKVFDETGLGVEDTDRLNGYVIEFSDSITDGFEARIQSAESYKRSPLARALCAFVDDVLKVEYIYDRKNRLVAFE